MQTQSLESLNDLYSRYLLWFRERAGKEALPWEKEDFPRFQSFNEDAYENDRIVLNRMYYLIPLSPSESASGRLDVFAFSVLNLLEKTGDEIVTIRPVEYRVE